MNTLKEWMDARGITPERAADIFGKSVGTIRNWRSRGVPPSQRDWVERRMQEYSGRPLPEATSRLGLEISRTQFREWNKAALNSGQLIEDWAISVLDEAAADHKGYDDTADPVEFPRAADDAGEYRPKNNGAA